jgi:beta-galactosidase/beta-glucuronidase
MKQYIGCIWALAALAAAEPIDLSGRWQLTLDRANSETPPAALAETIQLPGLLQAQGFGDAVSTETKWIGGIADRSWFNAPQYAPYRQPGNVKVPCWLQPDRHYAGVAWYQREIEIPAAWSGQRVVLTLERPHWETRVWLDGQLVGTNNSLSTPHVYALGLVAGDGATRLRQGYGGHAPPRPDGLGSGRLQSQESGDGAPSPRSDGSGASRLQPGKHTLTIRVDNRMVVDVGENSHSVTDHTQGNWNGIVGAITLHSTPPVWIEDVQVYPDAAAKTARVKVRIGNASGEEGRGMVQGSVFSVQDAGQPLAEVAMPVEWTTTGGSAAAEFNLPVSVQLWDEFTPQLFGLSLTLRTEPRTLTTEPFLTRFGLRTLSTTGTHFALNGRPIFLRGTLECAIFPKEGHPPTDVESWRRIVRICKAHGLNHIRFHSWCPPEAAFVAADEEGFYYQVEAASWANQSTTIGDGKPIDDVDLCRDRPHPAGLWQPSVLPADALRQRARRREARRVPREVGRTLQGEGPAPALHHRRRLAGAGGEPVSQCPAAAGAGVGAGTRLPHQRPRRRDHHRLPRVRGKAERAGGQP